jgi:AraC-like DNA-binding protein
VLEAKRGKATREQLASLLNYNGDHLNRITKKFSGMTLTEYSQMFCLSEAARLLAETSKSVSEIITELRFSNRSHFYHLFEMKYNATPSDYRKEIQKI